MRPNLVPLEIAPGLIEDETTFKTGQAGCSSLKNVRSHRGGLQVIGGWEFFTTEQLSGLCRGGHCWQDSDGEINIAFGTHTGLYVLTRGKLYNITPTDFVAGNADGYGGAGFGTSTYGSGTYGSSSSGVFYPLTWSLDNREDWLIANARGQKIWAWKNDTAAVAVELAGRTSIQDEDFTGYADQTAFDVDYTRGTGVTFDAANDEIDYDGTQTADSHVYRTVSGLTVGERYRITGTYTRSAGTIKATEDPAGTPNSGTAVSEASGDVAHVFIATATSHVIGVTGDSDFVGTITDLDVDQMGAPEIVESILVAPTGQVIAYGCEEELEVTQNARNIRWCHTQTSQALGFDDWTSKATNNAGGYVLRNSGRLIRAKEVGQLVAVWTDEGVFWQSFVGRPDFYWDYQRAGSNCGLIGPNAVAVVGSKALWCGTDYVFYAVSFGGEPLAIPSPIDQTFKDAQVHAQQEKIFACSVSAFNEVWWFYPHTDDGTECSRYYAFSLAENSWFAGVMDRTCMIDSGPYDYPVAVDASGFVYIHERGQTAAGNGISWHIETGDIYLDDSAQVVQVRGMRPDIHDQQGAITFTLKTKQYPQGDVTTHTPQTVVAGQDKVDFRASGAIVRLRWESELVGATCRLGRPVFDVTQRGKR